MVQHETPSHEERVCLIANETHGSFGREENRFVVIGANNKDEEDPSAPYVCYGDVITLRSSVTDRVLGVQKMEVLDKEHGGSTVTLKVGCFRRYGKYPPADRWVVLRGGSNVALVELGPDLPHDDHSRIPVYSGDPIVLRNDFTGGILSLGEEVDELFHALQGPDITGWSLNLITSSYQMHGGTASTEDDMELIEFLHRHNQCRPGKKETFQVVMANVPPCPNWIYQTEEGNERCFLDGSYLSNPNRHDASPELEDELWGDACPIPRLERGDDALQPPQKFASLSADVQETILLEEVIGAMMGLEGQFIRYHTGDFEPSNAEESMYPTQPGFVFAPLDFSGGKIDTSLEEIVSRILPLCSNYVSVNSYVQSCLCNYECGIIARALCEAMNKLLQEYLSFASNLDHQLREPSANNGKRMSMTMIHVRTQPASRTMSTLYQVVFAVQGRKGGDLLNSLQRLAKFNYSGDGKCNELLTHLLNVCAVHYARMLKSWLNTGRLHDPYNEFMIEVTNRNFQSNNVAIREGIEFEDWCRVNNTHVLMNLESSTELISPILTAFGVDRHRSTSHMSALDKVHTTGKYRRAIHFCHEGVPFLPAEEEETTSEEDAPMLLNPLKLLRYINVSYHKASDSLLQMMLEKYDLMASLQLMKRYFLLDQGDFFVEFLDIADEELARSASTLSQGRVQNAVVTSIGRTSDFVILPLNTNSGQISNLPHSSQLASALRCGFKKQSLVEELDDVHKISRGSSKGKTRQKELTGYEALQLEFEGIPFPTSLLLSHTQMRIFQLLFRQIFFAKYVERQLVGLWADHQLMKQMSSLREMRKTFCLRRRMIHFIQNFVYYIKFEVIEPNWIELESKLNAAKHRCSNPQAPESSGKFPRTVDDLLAEHNQFLISVINQCLLTNSDLIRASFKIMTTALLFTTQMKLFMGTTKINTHHETTRSECSKLRHSGAKKKIDDARKSQFRVQREERTRRCSDRIVREVCTENFQHMIDRFDNVFSSNLSDFMAALKCDYGRKSNGHFTNLFMQLDYNGYVSSSMENEQMSN
jgi:gamma-tubulin complex component 2